MAYRDVETSLPPSKQQNLDLEPGSVNYGSHFQASYSHHLLPDCKPMIFFALLRWFIFSEVIWHLTLYGAEDSTAYIWGQGFCHLF